MDESLISKVSNPEIVRRAAAAYGISHVYLSDKPEKKYYIIRPDNNKRVYFGSSKYEDFTKHKSPIRRNSYISRASNLPGKWRDDPYSANQLSLRLLWDWPG